jgi:glycerol-3-phosphate dehydrogenase
VVQVRHRALVGGAASTEPVSGHRILVDPDGVISVIGGAVGRYRSRAEDVISAVIARLDDRTRLRLQRRSPTATAGLRGSAGYREFLAAPAGQPPSPALDYPTRRHLAARYGGEARLVVALTDRDPALALPLHPSGPWLVAEALMAARFEMAQDLADVLDRRIPLSFVDPAAAAAVAPRGAEVVGAVLGWSRSRQAEEVSRYRAGLAGATHKEQSGWTSPN